MTLTTGIERIRIRNYRVLRDVELDGLTPITALLGPNGSGKSTVFDALAFLAEAFRGSLANAGERRGGIAEIGTHGSGDLVEIELTCRVDGASGQYRVVIDELEAWFLGDVPALRVAYPRLPEDLGGKARYRDPDATGKASRALEDLLQSKGYHRNGLAKALAAQAIAPHMNVENNRSMSFQVFRDGLRRLVSEGK